MKMANLMSLTIQNTEYAIMLEGSGQRNFKRKGGEVENEKSITNNDLSFLAAFALFIGGPTNNVEASEIKQSIEIQQESRFVTQILYFTSFPPYQYYYNDGTFRGYISRVSYSSLSDGRYSTLYAGTVYRNAPIPAGVTKKSD